jgi:hypothetical protein
MKLMPLFMALCVALATASYFPLNDARFANRTLWNEYTSSSLMSQAVGSPLSAARIQRKYCLATIVSSLLSIL